MTSPFILPISSDQPVGDNLFYDPVYDQIKEARREDDPTLSQGVWQREFKKSDWQLVESLCTDALTQKTKDLQIAGWLTEAWIMTNHLNGFQEGVNLIQSLCEAFWEQIHPEIKEDDKERRLHFFEWLDSTFSLRLSTIPFIEDSLGTTQLSLSDWMLANRLDNVVKRAPEPQKVIRKAVQNNEMTLERINQALGGCSFDLLNALNLSLTQSLALYESFKKSLDTLLEDNSRPAMNATVETLREMQRFTKAGLDNHPASSPSEKEEETAPLASEGDAGPVEESGSPFSRPLTRSNAYLMIGEIADFLQASDPHSPAPALLKRISTWENKSITDIFNDFGDSPETLVALAKLVRS